MFTVDELSVSRRSGAPEIPVLLTERLRLRKWTASDIDQLARLYRNPDVTRFFSSPRTTPDTLDGIEAGWHRHGFGPWAVADRKTGRFLGSISLATPGHWPTPEISWLLDPKFWGLGLATEGARIIVNYAFVTLDFSELMSVCLLGNKRSERVMQKVGMTQTSFLATANQDPLMRTYLMTREQWDVQARRAARSRAQLR